MGQGARLERPMAAGFHIFLKVDYLAKLRVGREVQLRVAAIAVVVPIADVSRRAALLPPRRQQLPQLATFGGNRFLSQRVVALPITDVQLEQQHQRWQKHQKRAAHVTLNRMSPARASRAFERSEVQWKAERKKK